MPLKTVTFEQRPERSERVSHVKILRRQSLRGESQGPQSGNMFVVIEEQEAPCQV